MYSVFSNNLLEILRLREKARLRSKDIDDCFKLKDVVLEIKQGRITNCPYIILSEAMDESTKDEFLYIWCTTYKLRKIVSWATINIIGNFKFNSDKTNWVGLRIITSMLNKLEGNTLSKNILIQIQLAIVENVNKAYSDFLCEDLPF